MPTMCTVTVVGHLTADPEPIPNHERAVRFRAWVSEKKKDGEKIFTHFRCAMFGPPAEWLLRDGKKGSLVAFSGRLHMEGFEKNDGTRGHSLEVLCHDARILDNREKDGKDGVRDEAAAEKAPPKPAQTKAWQGNEEPPF